MACNMCEAHINDAVRSHFHITKVSSSHTKGGTEILSEQPVDTAELTQVINATGYTVTGVRQDAYERKKFSLFGRKK